MPGGPKKVPTSCPHCGHVQLEPKGLISTYCRGCSSHYSVGETKPAAVTVGAPAKPSVLRKLLPKYRRRVVCHECGHEHAVTLELGATVCPGCGTDIDLRDIEIARHSTREIFTQGAVHVGRGAFLNSTRIVCGSLFVEGRVAGKITCSGTVRLRGHGICRSQIAAKNLLIDRGSQLRFPYTVHVEHALIRGHVEADIVCSGTLHVGRNGGLDGDVQARALSVDKGAFFVGAVEVSTQRTQPTPSQRREDTPRLVPVWNRGLAFGAG